VDLTPAEAPARRRRRSPIAYVVLALVLVAMGVVVTKALTSASLYFYNADEAVAKREALGDKRFRLQGTVLDPIQENGDGDRLEFSVAYNGVRVEAHHEGSPPELFKAGTPVVLEGRWDQDGDWFYSDRILVKHSEQYEADNKDRLKDAEEGGTSSTTAPTAATAAPCARSSARAAASSGRSPRSSVR
jgi:cytochrome c-type biogenesis protein CcmE